METQTKRRSLDYVSQRNMRTDRLTRIVTPITKILEVAYHIGAGCMVVGLVLFWGDRG